MAGRWLIVLDASATVDLLLGNRGHERIGERIRRPGETLHAPEVIDLEVLNALRRLERQRVVAEERAVEALEDFVDLPLQHYPHAQLRQRIWSLRHNFTVTDAAYVALAEALDAPLITTDVRIARAPGHSAVVELFN